jgi:hypothetical protein
MVEAFEYVRKTNPHVLISLGGVPINQRQDPQIYIYEKKQAAGTTTEFSDAGVRITHPAPADTSLRFTVGVGTGPPGRGSLDSSVVSLSTARFWSVGAESFPPGLTFDLRIRYRPDFDSLPIGYDIGLIEYDSTTTPAFRPYVQTVQDTGAKAITARNVSRQGLWALGPVKPGIVLDAGPAATLPGGYVLEQNFPNPFNPATTIRYTVGGPGAVSRVSDTGPGPGNPASAWVRLVVYDVLGREVAVLVHEPKAPGSHAVTFDAAAIASGVYLYRMDADSPDDSGNRFTEVRRMIVIK